MRQQATFILKVIYDDADPELHGRIIHVEDGHVALFSSQAELLQVVHAQRTDGDATVQPDANPTGVMA